MKIRHQRSPSRETSKVADNQDLINAQQQKTLI